MYQEAIFGVATPNGLRSFYKGKINNDMGEHAAGNNYSIWTSWTADKSVAEIFARGTSGKEGGIILEKDFDKKSVIINTSPEASLMQEAEWLVPGRVTGAKVNKLEAKK